VCKNTDKIYEEFDTGLGYYFSNPHIILDLILKTSWKAIGLIPDIDQNMYIKRSKRVGCIFHGDRILETTPIGVMMGEMSDAMFRHMDSLYPSTMFLCTLLSGE